MHSIGCYSVHRRVKVRVRKAEHLLAQAAVMLRADPSPPADAAGRIDRAWRRVCFHYFHDTLAGTCVPSAYEQVDAQLGSAIATADELLQHGLRRKLVELPDDVRQRIVLFNASDKPFNDYVAIEPWLAWIPWQPSWRLLDEAGRVVPCHRIRPEGVMENLTRLLLRIDVPAGELRVLRIDARPTGEVDDAAPSGLACSAEALSSDEGIAVSLRENMMRFGDDNALALPRLELIDDPSDTWSHGPGDAWSVSRDLKSDRYAETPAMGATWEPAALVDSGPLMTSLIRRGQIGDSRLVGEFRVYVGLRMVEWLLRVHWRQRHKLLKLTLPMPVSLVGRVDGIPGQCLARPPIGRECPVRDFTLLELADGGRIGVVCPDVFALDASGHRVRFTLLRSPLMAHHLPMPPAHPRGVYADQGEHAFRFRFFFDRSLTADALDHQAKMFQRPPLTADLTRGMPTWPERPGLNQESG